MGRIVVEENTSLAPYTIYKIGGPARFFVAVKSADELEDAVRFAGERGLPFFILGAGSNVLVASRGFDGVVIHMVGGEVRVEGDCAVADAGVMMARAVTETARAGLTGFEWAIGVPGTIGGSVRGNAGCFGGEASQVLERVRVLEITNRQSPITNKTPSTRYKFQTTEFMNKECQFGYRDSIFKRHPARIILSATLWLQKGDPVAIQENIRRITAERTLKQDIGTKSCGCIFKNVIWQRNDIDQEKLLKRFPELGQFRNQGTIPASFLIDRVGLKGRRVGSVVISPKHANYFVNEGGASAEEAKMLVEVAKDAVRQKYGITLEEEIQYVP